AALAAAWREGIFRARGTSIERRVLAALEALAVLDLDAAEKARALALEALQAAGAKGDRPSEAAFRLLRRTGRFASDDENLAIVRFGLRTAFPDDALSTADAAARAGFD